MKISRFGMVFAGTWLAYAGLYLCRKNFSVLMPFLGSSLGLSNATLADLVFTYSLTYAAGQFLSGSIADRFGARPLVAIGMAVSAACSALIAGAPGVTLLLTIQLVNGFAQSTGWPGLLKITSAQFSPAGRGVTMGWWSTNMVVGGFAATILATWFATGPLLPALGWQRAAWGPALLLALISILFLVLVPASSGLDPSREQRRTPAGVWREVLQSRPLWAIAIAYFCLKMMRYTFLFWLPLYMVQRLRYSPAEAGYTSSMYEVVGFLGVPAAGYVSDKLLGGQRFPAASGLMFLLAGTCLVFPQLSAMSRAGNIIAIGLAGALTFGPDTLLAGPATQDASSPEIAATAGGFVNGFGSLGQLLSPLLVAALTRSGKWDNLFTAFVGVALLGAATLAFESGREKVRLVPVGAGKQLNA